MSGITITSSSRNIYSNEIQGEISLIVADGVAPFIFEWSGPHGYYSTQKDIKDLTYKNQTLERDMRKIQFI